MIGLGTFFRPGTYISVHDSLNVHRTYELRLPDAAQNRIQNKLSDEQREHMKAWLIMYGEQEEIEGLSYADIDTEDVDHLLELWWAHYDQEKRIEGMIIADRRMFARIDNRVERIFEDFDIRLLLYDYETGEYVDGGVVTVDHYVNIREVANVRRLPLGTDNFGRDVLKQLVSATGASLLMGVVAGIIATAIGLTLGLLSGYVGGVLDDILMFIYNLFTVIPGFILLVLISFAIGQEQRGMMTVAIVIGMTSWVWTARSVRSQVMSLRNRDHVNMSKLSGHSLPKILARDIAPYIASYVVMAFILQVSTAILAEAGLSMIGLGPMTTEQATLGLMMNWSINFGAHLIGAWWTYLPVVFTIAIISFSLNLMNTGLDQIFNPQLREG